MGVGFTTVESESVVNHPVRRRIVRFLMWGGYSGITATVSTVVAGADSVNRRRRRPWRRAAGSGRPGGATGWPVTGPPRAGRTVP